MKFSKKTKKLAEKLRAGFSRFLADKCMPVSFAGEWDGVEQGISKHGCLRRSDLACQSFLRRNIHRLEKAISFPQKKQSYGANYIQDTVTNFAQFLSAPDSEPSEVKWASSVLARYFDSLKDTSDASILSAKIIFDDLDTSHITDFSHTPFPHRELSSIEIPSAKSFMGLLQKRVSCRWFTNETLKDEAIEYCVRAASQAASACNRQPFRFIHITTPSLKEQVVNLPLGTKGYGNDLPHLMVVVGDWSCFEFHRDRHLIFIDASLAVAQFLLALVVQGCAGVPINWPDIEDNNKTVRKLLSLEKWEMPIMLIGFGKPLDEATIPFSQKKSVTDLLSEQ